MTTPRDLLIVAMDGESGRSVDRGSLSLALAAAEAIDLLGLRAVGLDGDRLVPGDRPHIDDALLREAASSLAREEPYESVEDWLWRRGRDLAAAYLTAFEAEGLLTRPRRRLMSFRAGDVTLVDSPGRRAAVDRRSSCEPVLVALTAAVAMDGDSLVESADGRADERFADVSVVDDSAKDSPEITDDEVAGVLAALHDAVAELDGVRQRRAVEEAAFDNIWRGV